MLKCYKCKGYKSEGAFQKARARKRGYHLWCKECVNSYNRTKYADSPLRAKRKETQRKLHLKKQYGLSVDDYERLALSQNPVCDICKQRRKLIVDHNHFTGKVRGLLCRLCNAAIGYLHENPCAIQNANVYLKKHNTMPTDYYLISLIALTIWREARGEGLEGMEAVACVIRNRVKKGWGDWDAVIRSKNQFSSMSVKGDSQLTVWPDDDSELFKDVWKIAGDVFRDKREDITNGALFYANLATADSGWFFSNIVDRPDEHPQTAKIRSHTFYR